MNKKFFRIALLCAILGTGAAVTSCTDYDQEIADLQDQVTALEKKVNDLQSAINAGSVITAVNSTANGVTVTLSNGKTFELKNGVNGNNGANGSVVAIDEHGHWTIDGKDTGLAAKGEDGSYYVPNAETGCFDLVVPGKEPQATEISFLAPGTLTAVQTATMLTIYNVVDEEGNVCDPVQISLAKGLTSLVYRRPSCDDASDDEYNGVYFFTLTSNPDSVAVHEKGILSFKVFPKEFDVTEATFEFSDSYQSKANGGMLPTYVDGSAVLKNGILTVEFIMDTIPDYGDHEFMTSLDITYAGETISSDYFAVEAIETSIDTSDSHVMFTMMNDVLPVNATANIADSVITDVDGWYLEDWNLLEAPTYKFEAVAGASVLDLDQLANGVVALKDPSDPTVTDSTATVKVTSYFLGGEMGSDEFTYSFAGVALEPVVLTLDEIKVDYDKLPAVDTVLAKYPFELAVEAVADDSLAAFFEHYKLAVITECEGTKVTFNTAMDTMSVMFNASNLAASKDTIVIKIDAVNDMAHPDLTVKIPYDATHEHNFPAFNNNYVVAENTVAVNGMLDDHGVWTMKAKLSEQFSESIDAYTFTCESNKVEIAGGVIALKDTTVSADKPVEVQVVMKHAAPDTCSMVYNVRFVSPFTVEFKNVELQAVANKETSVELKKYVVIKHGDEKIFENGNLITSKAEKYGVTEVKFEFEQPEPTQQGLTVEDGKATWHDQGNQLQNDVLAKVKATVKINEFVKETNEAVELKVLKY